LVSFLKIVSLNGMGILFNIIQVTHWKIGTRLLQTIPSFEEWQGSLYTTMKYSRLNYLTNGGLLWIPIEVSKFFTV